MNAPSLTAPELPRWRQPGSSRVPFWAYTDAQLLKFQSRRCVYDSEMVLNSLISPV